MPHDSIWFNKEVKITDLDSFTPHTMSKHLGMQWLEIGPDYLAMKMPVDHRTRQPYGLLHGGASCALAETVGSVASHLVIDPATHLCVGLEINANHVRGIREGFVIARAIPLHLGKSTHLWDIKILDEHNKLICVSRLTVAILEKK